ncbi:MAG TPA: ATPase, T2SS/T4P/T4SS family [Candidatus Deferrimicrobiaceae bacterium]|nr:ATPase, T2SS/T4P/T4SS family [Candidatus Deferrimicrobiaceae bacterium]
MERRADVRGSQTELLDKLLKLGFLSPESLKKLKARGGRKGVPAVEAALLEGILHPDAKAWILADALGIPFLSIDPEAVPLSLAEILPEVVARENMAVPVSREGEQLTLAVADPFRYGDISRMEKMTGTNVRVVVCPGSSISRILDRFYPDARPLSSGEALGGSIGREEAEEWLVRGRGRRLAEKVLLHAMKAGISTVRIYPTGRVVAIDGDSGDRRTLLLSFPLRFRERLIGSFAELAGLSTDPSSLVESTFQMETAAGIRAFRISLLRGLSGVEAVVKVLPDLRSVIALGSIGFNPDQMEVTRRVLSMRDGIFLVSSPGPEGVATTIFAMLREAFREGTRVVTVEETHRFRNDGYIQLERQEVERRFGGKWVRLAETLEPDVLMVERMIGPQELHDLVPIARRGVPVFCGAQGFNLRRTLQALFSLEVDPFILVRVVRLVMHQRLVDLLCVDCRRAVPAVPSSKHAGDRYREKLETMFREVSFYVHAGCPRCQGIGYSGKMALFDLLPFTPGVQNVVLSDAPLEERIDRILEENLQSALPSVEDLLRRGMVTFDDVLPFFR